MGIGAWAQLALGLVQLLNWVAGRVEQSDWQNQGFKDAYLKALGIANERVKSMMTIDKSNQIQTDEELDKGLME